MRRKIGFLSVAVMTVAICAQAQSVRNPLNLEPANIGLGNGVSSKKLSGMTFYRPDGAPLERARFVYGENGRKISEQNQRWNVKDAVWTDVSGCDYSYGEGVTVAVSTVVASNSREDPSKTETYYDGKGRKSYSLSYRWDKNAEKWADKPAVKGTRIYDENGRVTEYAKMYRNKDTESWDIPMTRILYSYDENDKLSEEIIQSWKNNESWKNVGKYAYSHSENAGEVVCTSYVASGDDWAYDGKIVCLYDEDGDMARCEYYDKRTGESVSAYCVYTYSDTRKTEVAAVKEDDVKVYPNPAVSYFDLTVPEELVGRTAFFFDTSGSRKKSVVINNTRMKVDVSDLSTGIYFMKIDTLSKKIFIK
ncbi:MAG: T9SS type A sorting domain-containing protein [Tannerella sp.]|jgi:hypothetical protein|nr:T9SS type A sorting domain-containing protein [Tannerella sp.]